MAGAARRRGHSPTLLHPTNGGKATVCPDVTGLTIVHFKFKSAMMHSMTTSATGVRAQRRVDTLRSIEQQALRLTIAHGLDGWTMDELAESVGVSRRTLFNHVPGKLDAVLGVHPRATPERVAEFVAGGPSGDLVSDLGELAKSVLDDRDFDRETVAMRRDIMLANPRLAVSIHERFEEITRELVEHILAREGVRIDHGRARLLIRLIVALVDTCLLSVLEDQTGEEPLRMGDLFDQNLHQARELLAGTALTTQPKRPTPSATTPQEP